MRSDQLKRRKFITLLGGATAWPLAARAQQQAMPVIGFLCSLSREAVARPLTAFRKGLENVGFREGQTVAVEYRWAEGHYDRLPALAAELVGDQVGVIVTVGGDPPAFAAKAATAKIPIVFMVGRDPVKLGLVASLSRPGGNATGLNLLISEMESKRIDLLRDLAPSAGKFSVLLNPKNADTEAQLSDVQSAAQVLGRQIEIVKASDDQDLEAAFARMIQEKIEGFALVADPFFVNRRDRIISFAARNSIPAVYFVREFADSGGLISYGSNLADAYQQVGLYAGKVLSGVKPSELPVVQPTKFELVINLKTATALRIDVPPKLIALADETIE
jgi:putative ABC transport system substrate-binding protein